MNTVLDSALASLPFDGVFTIDHVHTAGGDKRVATRRVRAGRWVREGVGLYRLRDAPRSRRQAMWLALHEAGPGAVVSHGTAARELDLPMYAGCDDIHVTVWRGGNHLERHGVLHETSWLPPDHFTAVHGLPTTSIARTVFDLAGLPANPWAFRNEQLRLIHVARMKHVCNYAMAHLGLTHGALTVVLAALGRRGRPGSAIVREVLDELDDRYVPTESELEDMFVSLLRARRIEEPVKQSQFLIEIAGIVRVDFLYPAAKLIVEIDGRWHDSPLQREADAWRDAEFAALGYRVLRFRYRQMRDDPDRVARIVVGAVSACR